MTQDPRVNPYEPPPSERPKPGLLKLKRRFESKWLVVGLCGSVTWGFFIWAMAPACIGQIEPWDSPYPYYTFGMLLPGFLTGWFVVGASRHLTIALTSWFGVWIGQLLAVGTLPWMRGPIWGPLWMWALVLAIYSVLFVPGCAAGVGFRAVFFRQR